jgi:hypothetical protein
LVSSIAILLVAVFKWIDGRRGFGERKADAMPAKRAWPQTREGIFFLQVVMGEYYIRLFRFIQYGKHPR